MQDRKTDIDLKEEISTLHDIGYTIGTLARMAGLGESQVHDIISEKDPEYLNRFQVSVRSFTDLQEYHSSCSTKESPQVPRSLQNIVNIRKEHKWYLNGLEKHLILVGVSKKRDSCAHALTRVGLIDFFEGAGILGAEFVFPRGDPDTGPLKYVLSQFHANWFLDVQIRKMGQSADHHTIIHLGERVDWDVWKEHMDLVLNKEGFYKQLDGWKAHREFSFTESTPILPGTGKRTDTWNRIIFIKERIKGLSRFLLVFMNVTTAQREIIDPIIHYLPFVTYFHGKGLIKYNNGKKKSGSCLVLEILIPDSNISQFRQNLVDVLVGSKMVERDSIIIIPAFQKIPISMPSSYPSNPLNIFPCTKDGSRRRVASMSKGRILDLETQWQRVKNMVD
ncbi:hypothetical protein GF325_11935 [Candidatus Bathyarchaeota archaeon]|nr:hypothetical protein [Candidatus Bathyarchaeota archaeon]